MYRYLPESTKKVLSEISTAVDLEFPSDNVGLDYLEDYAPDIEISETQVRPLNYTLKFFRR